MKIKLILSLLLCIFALSCGSSLTDVKGELFVKDGEGGSTRYPSVMVKIIKKDKIKNIDSGEEIPLTDADYFATTDADGKFSVKVPNGDYIAAVDIFDSTYSSSNGIRSERFRTLYYWCVEFKADGSEKKIALDGTTRRGKSVEISQPYQP